MLFPGAFRGVPAPLHFPPLLQGEACLRVAPPAKALPACHSCAADRCGGQAGPEVRR